MNSLFSPNFLCIASEPEKSNLFKKEKYYSLQRKVKNTKEIRKKMSGKKKLLELKKTIPS